MKSMTGYGGARKANSSFRIESNLRTVNGRFLEIKPHMPRDYQSFEADIKILFSSPSIVILFHYYASLLYKIIFCKET